MMIMKIDLITPFSTEKERCCAVCKTICFSSALTINRDRDDSAIICLRHFKNMEIDPTTLILRYRYTLDELAILLQGLKSKAESYDSWVGRVRQALEAKGEKRLRFEDLKEMYGEALARYQRDLVIYDLVVFATARRCAGNIPSRSCWRPSS